MTSPIKPWEMSANFRSPLINEPRIFGGPNSFSTPAGTVMTPMTTSSMPPALPPRSYDSGFGNNYSMGGGGMGMGGYGGGFGGGYGSMGGYGGGYNSYGGMMGGGYNSFGGGMYGGGGYNRFGGMENPNDPENRFVHYKSFNKVDSKHVPIDLFKWRNPQLVQLSKALKL